MKLLQELQTLTESKAICVADHGATVKDILSIANEAMDDIAHEFAHYKKDATSRAAAPDTSKFRATVGGMIDVEHNVHVHGGQYGISKTYKVFLKIGGGIDHKVEKQMIDRLASHMSDNLLNYHEAEFKIPGSIYCKDGMVIFSTEDGTNWGGVGAYVSEYSEYSKKQYLDAVGDE